jgi:16S rRNA (uracil1498-N3)-methyltransferase
MSIRRLFCSRKKIQDGEFTVTGEEAYHGIRVLRLCAGDSIRIFTEQGSEFLCTVTAAGKNQLKARIQEKLDDPVESPLKLYLIQGLPKAQKLEQIIVHGTELGMTAIQPIITERSMASGEKRERWRRLALEAAKQSGRRGIPFIEPIRRMDDIDFTRYDGFLKLIAAGPSTTGSLRSILKELHDTESVVIAVGPEGGFTPEETALFASAGFKPFGMGPRTLRTQTASLAIFAVLQYMLGDWNWTNKDSAPTVS